MRSRRIRIPNGALDRGEFFPHRLDPSGQCLKQCDSSRASYCTPIATGLYFSCSKHARCHNSKFSSRQMRS